MAKEIAIGKRAKISQAQQYMILAVLGASVVLGAAISAIMHFVQQISFNSKVIAAEEASIVNYSNVIKNAGVCKAPSGTIYSEAELKQCEPDSIQVSWIPGTLRANIIENLAANAALNSVPKEDSSACINQGSGKAYTYKELMDNYKRAQSSAELVQASNLIKSCSALRVIPDALPAFKNEEALLASLNKLFILSGWQPESISPSGDTDTDSELPENLHELAVTLSIDAGSGTTMAVLDNMERSIREFDIKAATITWSDSDTLEFQASATAYYMDEATITEQTTVITPERK